MVLKIKRIEAFLLMPHRLGGCLRKIGRLNKKVFLDTLDVMGCPIENKLITLIIFMKPEIITFL